MSSSPEFHVLVFSKTTGYRHASIPAGVSALKHLAHQSSSTGPPYSSHSFSVNATEDASVFKPASLAAYRVIVLLQVSGDFLTRDQLDALKGFVRAGGGIVAVHCASTGMPSDPWYGRMIGAVFSNHPDPQPGVVTVEDRDHCIVKDTLSSSRWRWHDEWYNYRENPRLVSSDIRVLLSVDETSYEGGQHGADHPIAWCHEFEGARVFYTALGHFDEAYADETFLGQLRGAIEWTARVSE